MNTDGSRSPKRTLVESPSFSSAVELLGGAERIDYALWVVTTAISQRPDTFDFVRGFEPIRLGKTEAVLTVDPPIPPLRIWYREIDQNQVELLWIELRPDEEDE